MSRLDLAPSGDRELLEAAALAAGIEKHYPFGPGEIYVRFSGLWAHRDTSDAIGALKIWNPLADDGDAMRLAVKLGLSLRTTRGFEPDESTAISNTSQLDASYLHAGDPYAATRRAIVRAAAAIGSRT